MAVALAVVAPEADVRHLPREIKLLRMQAAAATLVIRRKLRSRNASTEEWGGFARAALGEVSASVVLAAPLLPGHLALALVCDDRAAVALLAQTLLGLGNESFRR